MKISSALKRINKRNLHGFTLVELIVVVTILVILGTIGFINLQGYSGSARDSSRASEIAILSKSLEISFIKTNSYPDPDNFFSVTYSGGILWKQGNLGEGVMNILNAGQGIKLSEKPTDPLVSSREYAYSKLAFGNAYQLKSDWEGDVIAFGDASQNSKVESRDRITTIILSDFMGFADFGFYRLPQASAATGNPALTYIKSNYNGIVTKTETGSVKYLIAVPSLFLNTGSGAVALLINTQTGFYIHGQTNSGGILFTPRLVFSSGSLPSTTNEKIAFANGVANAYSGNAILASHSSIKPFVDALTSNNSGTLFLNLGGGLVSGSLGGTTDTSAGSQALSTVLPLVAGGDCALVSNTLGADGDMSTCVDNRVYNHADMSAFAHDKTYSLLKITGVWWFNENLAYPPATGYQGSNTWSTSDLKYYSCPGNNGTTTADCSLVSTLGYLYQWSAAMSGATSNDNPAARTQGICPPGWGLPTKADFTSTANAYWPTNDYDWEGTTTNWSRYHPGYRNPDSLVGYFNDRNNYEYIWTSLDNIGTHSWAEHFGSGYPTQSYRNYHNKAFGFSVRCLKN